MESQFVPQENARRNQDRYPLATETVLVCPYVIMAKILLQELWMRGYDRDDEVQDEISIGWRN